MGGKSQGRVSIWEGERGGRRIDIQCNLDYPEYRLSGHAQAQKCTSMHVQRDGQKRWGCGNS